MENKKKDFIIIISFCSFPYGDASDNAIYTFMSGFNEHGVDGEVLCAFPNLPLAHSDTPPVGDYCGVKYRFLHGRTCRSNIRIKNRINLYLFYPYLKSYIREKVQKYNLTVLFVAQINERFYKASRICHQAGARVVLVSCEYPSYLTDHFQKRIPRFKEMSSCIDKYIFETKTLDNYTRKVLNENIDSIIIPATMPFDDILDCVKTGHKAYIAYCGSIYSESKDGLLNIIKAYSTFHKVHPEIGLKFVGRITNQEYFKNLQKLTKELNLDDSVSFAGEVNREEFVQYVTNSSLMIVAKPKDSYYGGGLSSKVIEYLFSGNPVLITDSDDYVQYLTHEKNVFFVHDNKPETLSSAMIGLFNQPEKMKLIGEEGRKYAMEHFNYHKLTKGLLEFILK